MQSVEISLIEHLEFPFNIENDTSVRDAYHTQRMYVMDTTYWKCSF